MHPVTTSRRPSRAALTRADSRMASIDSSLAGPMKAHVFTTRTSAASGSSTISCPARVRTPSMTSVSTWFFGQPRVTTCTRRRLDTCSITEVDELHRDPEVAVAQQLDHALQVVALLPGHAHLIGLDGRLDLELRILDQLDDLARLVGGDAFLEREVLLRAAARPGLDRFLGQRLQRHLPARELLAQDVGEGPDLEIVGGAEVDGVRLTTHLRRRSLEIEALPDLLQGLVDRVVDLLEVDLAHDVERRHRGGAQ